MKKFFLIILYLFSTTLISQELKEFNFRLSLLEKQTKFKKDTIGISEIVLPNYYCFEENENKSILNWHLQDLNNDGLKDLIFSGSCQPYPRTAIFLNLKNSFEFAFDYGGEILSIKNNKINIFKEACCCDFYSELVEVEIKEDSVVVNDILSIHSKTELLYKDNLQTKLLSGILRNSPKIDDILRKNPCEDGSFRGNQMIVLKNKEAIVIKEKDNWLQVLVKNEKNNSIIGWIKK